MSTCTCHGAIREGLPAAKQTLALVSDPLGGTPGGLVPGLNVELETMNSGQFQTPGRDQGQCVFGDSPTAVTSGNPVADPVADGGWCPATLSRVTNEYGRAWIRSARAAGSHGIAPAASNAPGSSWNSFRIAESPELTRAYLIAYLRADGAHATSAGQVDVICAGLAARCVQHSGGEPGASEALLAASAIYAVFFSATFALAVGVGSPGEMTQGLRDLITAQTRPFERAGTSAGVSS